VATVSETIGRATNNEAEYHALIRGLKECLAQGAGTVQVRSDSELMVRQMTGVYRVRNARLVPLVLQATELVRRFSKVGFDAVPRERNAEADRLANEALDAGAESGRPQPTPAIEGRTAMREKCVLAYSGGLDTSVILKWLAETYDYDVIAFCADVGQGDDELEGIEQKALNSGAADFVMLDLREEFARDFVFPMLRAGAVYEGTYLLGTSIARPLLAKAQIMVARERGATAVAHGATGKGNDQVRFELTYRAFEPGIKIIAPWRDEKWPIRGRADAIEYAAKHQIPIKATAGKSYSQDGNLLHLSFESGILEDPWAVPPKDMFERTVSPEKAPDRATEVEIDFERGVPVAVNGECLSPAALLAKLNELGGKNGVGRVDMVENRYVGMKSRGVYETPGGTIIRAAHRAVESITMDREVMRLRDTLVPTYSGAVYNGYWFAPEMKVLNTFMDAAQANVTGTARVRLYKGSCTVVGRKSPVSLYDENVVTFEDDAGVYRQSLATGFIELNSLRLTVAHQVHGDPA